MSLSWELISCDCDKCRHAFQQKVFQRMDELKSIQPPLWKAEIDQNKLTELVPIYSNKGWQCPGCDACYAPWVPQCFTCGQEQEDDFSFPTNTYFVDKDGVGGGTRSEWDE